MPKRDTIDAIRRLNPTAAEDFLDEFSGDELTLYLERLVNASRREPDEASVEHATSMSVRNGAAPYPLM